MKGKEEINKENNRLYPGSLLHLKELSTLLSKLEFNSFKKEIYLWFQKKSEQYAYLSVTYPELTFLNLASSCSNRLVPPSDSAPKLQFVFLRKWKRGLYQWPLKHWSHEIIQQVNTGFLRGPELGTVTRVWERVSECFVYWLSEMIIKLLINSRRWEHQAYRKHIK